MRSRYFYWTFASYLVVGIAHPPSSGQSTFAAIDGGISRLHRRHSTKLTIHGRDGGGGDFARTVRRSSSIDDVAHDDECCNRRRAILVSLLVASGCGMHPESASAAMLDDEDDGMFGTGNAMDGISRRIRTSVVRGARLIDKADGAWERLSDDLGLGSERNRPKRNVIDAGDNAVTREVMRGGVVGEDAIFEFDESFALAILRRCDEAFLECLGYYQPRASINDADLGRRIEQTRQLVRKTFLSSSAHSSVPSKEREFNFECYAHFRVYNEVLIEGNIAFVPFRRKFGTMIGTFVLQLAPEQREDPAPSSSPPPPSSSHSDALANRLTNALRATDNVATFLRTRGLVSSWERSIPLDDDVEDFADLSSYAPVDLTYSLALNGDVTLDSQLLLQELGYRLYPSIGRWTTSAALSRCIGGGAAAGGDDDTVIDGDGWTVNVQIDDYYMDTNYNSNPDLFEVKQILLNIVIQRE